MRPLLIAALALLTACPNPKTPPAGSADVECKVIYDGRDICFPAGHVCEDPHGVGDGTRCSLDF